MMTRPPLEWDFIMIARIWRPTISVSYLLMNATNTKAMEFLYTYTWGEESYAMEVQEQFGYYTPSEYIEMLQKAGNCKVIECKHYLQEGYEENLLKKIEYYDINWQKTSLPDSTCIIVVEKL